MTAAEKVAGHILVVDDNATSRKLLQVTLEAEGYAVVEAVDGLEALTVLEREKVDAIISDILMPRMDGFRLCREVRNSEKHNALPFIIYSCTYTSAGDEKLALDLGVDKYVRKPAPSGAILNVLKEVGVEMRPRAARPARMPDVAEVMKEYSEVLVQKLEEKNEELRRVVEKDHCLARLGERALCGQDLGALATEAVEVVAAELAVDYCGYWETLPEGGGILLRAGTGWQEGRVGVVRVSGHPGDSQAAFTLQSDQPVIVEELRAESRFHPADLLFDHGVVSGLSVSVHTSHAQWGVLSVHMRSPRAWRADEISFLKSVANVLAAAISRVRAEEALRELNLQLEETVRQRTGELNRLVQVLREEVEGHKRARGELKQAHDDLAARAGQLRALASELTLAEQRERRRLAHILHDRLQQLLVGSKFRVAILGRAGDQLVQEGAREIEVLLDQCIAESRSLTAELSPPILHEGGLGPALEWLARWMADKHGMFVDLALESDAAPAAEDVNVLLFEAVRELLFNAVKHSGAKSAAVSLRRLEGGLVQIVVSDAGRGFDPKAVKPAGVSGGGFGLFSIRERLDLIGGQMGIDSAPGRGSRFALTAPLGRPVSAGREVAAAQTVVPRELPAVTSAPKPGERIRVLLVDDHVVMREGLARLLGGEPDIEVVGEAADGQEGVELSGQLLPDVILMDTSMPRLSGVEATRAIRNQWPEIRVIGLSMFEEAERAQAMRDAGAVAYLSKSGPSPELLAAIRTAAGGAGGEARPVRPVRKGKPARKGTRRRG